MKRGYVFGSLGALLLILLSFLWMLPASWVAKQGLAKMQGESSLPIQPSQLGEFSGRWWSGQAKLYHPQTHFPVVRVQWQLQGVSWLWGSPTIQLRLTDFFHPVQVLTIALEGNLWQSQAELSALQGRLSLTTLSHWVSAVPAMQTMAQTLQSLQGAIRIQQIHAQLPLSNTPLWPQNTAGKITFQNLQALGIQVPKLAVTLSQPNKALIATLSGQDAKQGWQLVGKGVLQPQGQYQILLTVTSQPGKALPEWAPMFMRKTASNRAVLDLQGSLK